MKVVQLTRLIFIKRAKVLKVNAEEPLLGSFIKLEDEKAGTGWRKSVGCFIWLIF